MLHTVSISERTVVTKRIASAIGSDRGMREVIFEGTLGDAFDWAHRHQGLDLSSCLASFPDRGARPFTAPASELRLA